MRKAKIKTGEPVWPMAVAWTILVMSILLAILNAGCRTSLAKPPIPADSALGSIHARADVIETTTGEAVSKAQAKAIKLDVSDAKKDLAQARDAAAAEHEDYLKFQARWYVRLGVWINRTLWTLVLGWIGAGVLGAIFAPALWAKQLLNVLPLSNIFTILARKIGRDRNE